MIAAEGVEEEGEEQQQQQQQGCNGGEGHPSLQNYFTMPFALHLRPLPHVSFLAHQDSEDSSEVEWDDKASTSSQGSNYRAGTHRLKPVVQSAPPHSLSIISHLLERTECLEAVPIWVRLIALLEEADDDAHFVNLRHFFDARFDSRGRLIQDKVREPLSDDEKEGGLFRGGAALFKRAGRLSQSRVQSSHFAEEGKRRASNSSRSASNLLLGRTKSKAQQSMVEDQTAIEEDEYSSAGEEIRSQRSHKSPTRGTKHLSPQKSRRHFNGQQQRMSLTAPEIMVPRSKQQQNDGAFNGSRQRASTVRPVRFRVRLDLHNIGMAPRPPRRPTSLRRIASTKGRQQQHGGSFRQQPGRLATSPDARLHEGGGEIQRVTSIGASSDHSFAGSLSLRPAISPDSVRSQPLSEASHSDDYDGRRRRYPSQREALSASPPRGKAAGLMSKQSSLGQSSSAAGPRTASSATNATSDYGTSPEVGEEGLAGRKTSIGSGAEEGKRRPSIIQRLMGFSGRKGSYSRKRSGTGSTKFSNASVDDVLGMPLANVGENETPRKASGRLLTPLQTHGSEPSDGPLVTSPTSLEVPRSVPFAIPASLHDESGSRVRTAEQSDWSNEEALDTADDEGSVASSSGWAKILSAQRRASSGAASGVGASGLKVESDLRPVQEGRVFDDVSVFSGNYHDDADIEEEDEEGRERDWEEGEDLLSLFRAATEKTLHLRTKLPASLAEREIRTPRSSSTIGGAKTPPGGVASDEGLQSEGDSEPKEPESWWLCGSTDPLPISFACALSQSLGWQGVMELCYGKESKCERAGTFASLSKAAELHGKQENESSKVRNWAQAVSTSSMPVPEGEGDGPLPAGDREEPVEEMLTPLDRPTAGTNDNVQTANGGLPGEGSDVAPSESASAAGAPLDGKGKQGKLSRWMNRMPRRSASAIAEPDLFSSLAINDDSTSGAKETRTWQDWADLLTSISAWMDEYELCRVRNGMAREMDHEPVKEVTSREGEAEQHPDSGFVEAERTSKEEDWATYSSIASYQVPRTIIMDALDVKNGFRRRHGIPEGLPDGPDGQEFGEYRWARSKLSSGQFATPLVLASSSLAYFFGQLASSEWTYNSSWELDYLEMCVFHSQIISTRFPSPSTSIIPFDQVYQPDKDDSEARKRAITCPYPRENAWSSSEWLEWLRGVKNGMILVPAVSWQAWWTLIAVLNGADGSGRPLDLQVKAAEEPFSALDDMHSIYI